MKARLSALGGTVPAASVVGALAAVGTLAATLLTAVACVGPLVAILLGIGGFGWLTRYAHLQLPATIATAALIALGFYATRPRKGERSCERRAGQRRRTRLVLWAAVFAGVTTNLFEYVVMPRLG